jgi:hypothetical protein
MRTVASRDRILLNAQSGGRRMTQEVEETRTENKGRVTRAGGVAEKPRVRVISGANTTVDGYSVTGQTRLKARPESGVKGRFSTG